MSKQHDHALIVFCRTPNIVRDDISVSFASLPWEDIDALFTAFVEDLLTTLRHIAGVDVLVYRNPEELPDDFFSSFRQMVHLFDINNRVFSHMVEHAVDSAFQSGYQSVVVLLDNSPLIMPEFLQKAFSQLGYEDDCFVLCPTFEGRCALVGMKSNHSKIFDIAGGDPIVQPILLLQRLCAIEAHLFLFDPVHSLDSAVGLSVLREEIARSNSAVSYFPSRTKEIFEKLGKKYGRRKVNR